MDGTTESRPEQSRGNLGNGQIVAAAARAKFMTTSGYARPEATPGTGARRRHA